MDAKWKREETEWDLPHNSTYIKENYMHKNNDAYFKEHIQIKKYSVNSLEQFSSGWGTERWEWRKRI